MRVIIVGAGILGASAAYHLAKADVEVILIDRADADAATQAGAGIVSPWHADTPDPARYAISNAGARYYPELVAMLAEMGAGDVGYKKVGSLVVSEDPAFLDSVEERTRTRAASVPEAGAISRIQPGAARELFPPLGEHLEALHVEGGARVDGRRMRAALCVAAEAHGAQRMVASATLNMEGGRATGVLVEGRLLGADLVIAAPGAWAVDFLAPIDLRLKVTPQRGQILHFRREGVATKDWPTVAPMNDFYLLAFDDSRVVVGATREGGVGFDRRLTAGGVASVLNAGLAAAPGLADWTLAEMRIGFRPLSPDMRPMLGPAPGVEGLLIGAGLGASGLSTGPMSGRILAELALGRPTSLPLADYPLVIEAG